MAEPSGNEEQPNELNQVRLQVYNNFIKHINYQLPQDHCFSCTYKHYKPLPRQYYSLGNDDEITLQIKAILSPLLNPLPSKIFLCDHCKASIDRNQMPDICQLNNLLLTKPPDELRQLSTLSRRLITPISFNHSITTRRGGQQAITGMSIAFPVDIARQFSQLPLTMSESNDIYVRLAKKGSRPVPIRRRDLKVNFKEQIIAF